MAHDFHYLQQAAHRIGPKVVVARTAPGPGPGVDAFGRARVSSPTSVWDNKNIHDKRTNHWDEIISGGGVIAHIPDESSVSLTLGTADGDRAVRQTQRYLAYVPGRSQLVTMTGVMAPGKDNLEQYIGIGDDDNGLFWVKKGKDIYVMVRTKASGSVVDTLIHQNDASKSTDGQSTWNLDQLDGSQGTTNSSHIILDPDKAQIFSIDFEWLGVGQVRFGLDFGGNAGPVHCHQVLNANVLDTVYMSTPTLPLRYEIKNNGATASASVLKEICSSLDSEGGYLLPGYKYSCSNEITVRSVGTTRVPILAFRPLLTFGGKVNRRTARFLNANFYVSGNADVFFEVVHLHPTIIDTGGAWLNGAAGGIAGSAMEFNRGLTVLSGDTEHTVHPDYVSTGQGSAAAVGDIDAGFISEHEFIYVNGAGDDALVYAIFARTLTGTADVAGSMEWIEFD